MLGVTQNGYEVFDRKNSHNHVDLRFLAVAVGLSNPNGNFWEGTVTLPIPREHGGMQGCIPVLPGQTTFLAQRRNRAGMSKFIDAPGIQTNRVHLVMKKDPAGYWVLMTAFWGEKAALEPWDPRATEADRRFWESHALSLPVCGHEII